MERSLSAVAVQGSALGKGCVGTEQTSDRHVTDKQEKRGSQSFGSRENANGSHHGGILHTC